MKLFRDYTFKWWQVSLFKIYLFSFGLAVGAYWPDFVGNLNIIWIPIIIILTVYFIYTVFANKI
jgi:hypothetical protein